MEGVTATSSPPTNYVLDACALLAFLLREPGASVVDGLLAANDAVCYAHVVNLCEVYYDFVRNHDSSTAQQAIQDLLTGGVVPRDDIDTDFWQHIGDLKVKPGKLSLADCFALALASRLDANLVTSD